MSPLHHASQLVIASLAFITPAGDAEGAVVAVEIQPCEVAVEVTTTVPLRWTRPEVLRFRRSVEEVWRPHGVRLCWREGENACPAARATVFVRLADDVPRNEPPDPEAPLALGWIGFSERRGPGPFIVLSVRHASEMLSRVRRASRRLGEMPAVIAHLLPQALGRALAHELGHYLLARRTHSGTGIMRAALTPDDLADGRLGRRGRVAPTDARMLSSRCPRR